MPTNALYSQQPSNALTVDDAVQNMLGMQPGMDRLNLLPRHDKNYGWIAPNFLYQLARAAVAPGVAAHGGYVSPEDAVNFAGNVSLGSYGVSRAIPNAAPGPGKTLPMTVYHGSPHNFDAFDISKIGTGEGAQAYGHGLYVAENPGVAKTYSAMMPSSGTSTPRRFLQGVELQPGTPEYHAATLMDAPGRTLASVRKEVASWIADAATWDAKRLADKGEQQSLAGWQRTLETLNKATSKADFARKDAGHLYHVDLPDEHIAKMLDWDKPLSQQPESVQRALANVGPPELKDGMALAGGGNLRIRESVDGARSYYLEMGGKQFTLSAGDVKNLVGSGVEGKSVYQALSTKLGGDKQASEYLKQQGIPGIKYWDGGSRAAGNGTRNYVVFDDKLLKILKKE